jgi:arsenate reductase (thioredoxin)
MNKTPRMHICFICTANSCRSQMAEAWAAKLFPAGWSVSSCGLVTYRIVSATRAVMAEVGLDMDGQASQSMDEYDLDSFDFIVTLSKEAGRFLPKLQDPTRHLRRPIDDPMSFEGTEEEAMQAFREGRDRIRSVVSDVIKEIQSREKLS